ncbi:MAG: hypothetical protein JNL85_11675 [Rubrivivax sp.]|nr:hypothetical protein [Rubrivivax sp.]
MHAPYGIHRLVVAALAVMALEARSGSLADELTSKSFWSNFDWRTATTSTVWTDSAFSPYSSSASGDVFEKNQRLPLLGRIYNVSLVRSVSQAHLPNYLVAATSLESLKCSDLVSEWSQILGREDISMDNSYKPTAGYTLGEIVTVWRLKNTNAVAQCVTLGPTLPGSFVVTFRPSEHPVPESPVHLNCTRNFSPVGTSPDARSAARMAISIIPSQSVLADADGLVMVTNVRTTFAAFEWTISTDVIVQTIRIDRTNGFLSGAARSKSDGRLVGTYQGECEKRIQGERRF